VNCSISWDFQKCLISAIPCDTHITRGIRKSQKLVKFIPKTALFLKEQRFLQNLFKQEEYNIAEKVVECIFKKKNATYYAKLYDHIVMQVSHTIVYGICYTTDKL